MNENGTNPHWKDGYPAWDVTLSNGSIDKGVRMKEIGVVHSKMYNEGLLGNYDLHIDVVRQRNIDNYVKWREANPRH